MKRLRIGLILISIMVLILTGCSENPDQLKAQIAQLQPQRDLLLTQVTSAAKKLEDLQSQIAAAGEKLDVMNHQVNGETPKYILVLELKQEHFTLDIGEAIKDSMNKIEFPIYVDEDLYNSQQIGQELLNEFREGSFWVSGSIGNWVITVKDKKIEYVK